MRDESDEGAGSAMNSRFDLVSASRRERSNPDALFKRDVPKFIHDLRRGAPQYQLGEELAAAVNVALSVGAPLLLTGEPGTGKSQLAYYLAWYFQLDEMQPFTLHVKSTSSARDLFYTFDTVGYFHRAQTGRAKGGNMQLDPREFRTKQALWLAIEEVNANRPAIVLIDEIDKAPRDFPNDLLHELDQFEFIATHTKEPVRLERDRTPPMIVITSNSEKRLPQAFLRRCVFHHIKFDQALVKRAVVAWRRTQRDFQDDDGAGAVSAGDVTRELDERDQIAIQRFMEVREHPRMQKKPATAELLAWLTALDAARKDKAALTQPLGELPFLAALVKDQDDLDGLARSH